MLCALIFRPIVESKSSEYRHESLPKCWSKYNTTARVWFVTCQRIFKSYQHIKQVPLVTFKTAVGSNYFFEIAKLRALRWLWQSLLSGIGFDDTPCHILTTTTERNKTIYSYNNNLLRSTTECMSAALGGADTIVNMPYDNQYHNPNDFGQRIARNQLLILKHESFFQAVQNPTDGTYYIDYLTHSLANQALELFKSIEAKGGFMRHSNRGSYKHLSKTVLQKNKRHLIRKT